MSISRSAGFCIYPALAVFFWSGWCAAAATPVGPAADIEAGAMSYVRAAKAQLADIRQAIDRAVAALPEGDRDKYNEVYENLAACDRWLDKVQKAGRRTFDGRKKEFEETLRELIAEISRAQAP